MLINNPQLHPKEYESLLTLSVVLGVFCTPGSILFVSVPTQAKCKQRNQMQLGFSSMDAPFFARPVDQWGIMCDDLSWAPSRPAAA